MDVADKDKLLAPRTTTASGFPEDDVPVPGFGVVRVRGLSRGEVLDTPLRGSAREASILHRGVVAPSLTEGEAEVWLGCGFRDEIGPVVERIVELSAVTQEAAKAAYKSVRGQSGPRKRALPSREAGDDGDAAAG